jgi:hypothetical protein
MTLVWYGLIMGRPPGTKDFENPFMDCVCAHCSVAFACRTSLVLRKKGGKYCSVECSVLARNVPLTLSDRVARFASKVDRSTRDSGCWLWLGAKNRQGYGSFNDCGKTTRAHRFAFFAHHGWWPKCALHRCDNPSCVNPNHLWEGSIGDNNRDREQKGRGRQPSGDRNASRARPERLARGRKNGAHTKPHRVRRGSNHGMARLSESDIPEILSALRAGGSARAIAAQYGVTPPTVKSILNGRTWRHITGIEHH